MDGLTTELGLWRSRSVINGLNKGLILVSMYFLFVMTRCFLSDEFFYFLFFSVLVGLQ